MGFSAVLAGLVISVQYIATFLSRPWAGRISDRRGAKISVLWGMAACTASRRSDCSAAVAGSIPSLDQLCRLGCQSAGSRRRRKPGLHRRHPVGYQRRRPGKHRPRHLLQRHQHLWRTGPGRPARRAARKFVRPRRRSGCSPLPSAPSAFVIALRKAPVPVTAGKHLPFRHVVGRVAPHGIALALGGVGYSVLATFVTLFYASRHWNGAAFCLTAFGLAFIGARLLFIHTIDRFGGFPSPSCVSRWFPSGCCCFGRPIRPGWPSLPQRLPALDIRSFSRLSAWKP